MKVLLQTNSMCLDTEENIISELLYKVRYIDYEKVSLDDLRNKEVYKQQDLVPIGTIEFVSEYLKNAYNIKKINPIEIPEYLRTDEFLKRDYKIVNWENIPKRGRHFIKDVSKLKAFGHILDLDYLDITTWADLKPSMDNLGFEAAVFNKEHLYQVSSEFDIQSEYRVYVLNHKIENICNYNGDCTIFPDINLIKKAIALIEYHEKWLKSYTIDIMVGPEGTAIIEIHNFQSVGLYSTLWGQGLLYAYRDGIDYIINDNKQITI